MCSSQRPENGADSEPVERVDPRDYRPGFNYPKPMRLGELPTNRQETLRARLTHRITEDPVTGCWLWRGAAGKNGYGRMSIGGNVVRFAHRIAYELYRGPIPPTKELDHLCRNHGCVNPWHLQPVTRRENLLRGDTFASRHAATTACPKGHPYDEVNTLRDALNRRFCRTCRKARAA